MTTRKLFALLPESAQRALRRAATAVAAVVTTRIAPALRTALDKTVAAVPAPARHWIRRQRTAVIAVAAGAALVVPPVAAFAGGSGEPAVQRPAAVAAPAVPEPAPPSAPAPPAPEQPPAPQTPAPSPAPSLPTAPTPQPATPQPPATPAPAPAPVIPPVPPGLSSSQVQNATTIARVAVERGLPAHAVTVALATALQESGLENLNWGDRDSLGLFQQRPSQGWGSPDQVMDPRYAAGKFYDGLVQVPGWDVLPVTVAAQEVQRSAFPDAYAKWEGLATELATAVIPVAQQQG